jgi:hypothetical protein
MTTIRELLERPEPHRRAGKGRQKAGAEPARLDLSSLAALAQLADPASPSGQAPAQEPQALQAQAPVITSAIGPLHSDFVTEHNKASQQGRLRPVQ